MTPDFLTPDFVLDFSVTLDFATPDFGSYSTEDGEWRGLPGAAIYQAGRGRG